MIILEKKRMAKTDTKPVPKKQKIEMQKRKLNQKQNNKNIVCVYVNFFRPAKWCPALFYTINKTRNENETQIKWENWMCWRFYKHFELNYIEN